MNLHAIANASITAVNPNVVATVKRSGGYMTNPDGTRISAYTTVANVVVQVQALTYNDLVHLEGMNIQGVRRALYLSGEIEAVVRVNQQGGDLIIFPAGTFPEGNTWLAAYVLEAWPPWRKLVLTLQDGT